MKPLRKLFDRLGPHFEKGARLERFYPIYEVIDTFFYSSDEVTTGQCHIRDGLEFKRMMSAVLVALAPCAVMAMVNTGLQVNRAMLDMGITAASGWRGDVLARMGVGYDPTNIWHDLMHGALYFLPVYVVCFVVGILWEMLFSVVRGHEISEGYFVTALLLPLTLPPNIPLWQVALGSTFAAVVAKELFGGTGRNFLNPALAGRAFLFFAYPAQLSGDITVWTAGDWAGVDGFSGATSLSAVAADGMQAVPIRWWDGFLGTIPGCMGETSTLACLIGAAILLVAGVGSWRIMSSMLIGAMAFAAMLWGIGSDTNPMFQMPPHWHLVVGGFAFGLVFMATDPVSAAMTDVGQWIYGALIGALVILVRVVNPAFPEGTMLAILLGNAFAPLIDYYVVRKNIKNRMLHRG